MDILVHGAHQLSQTPVLVWLTTLVVLKIWSGDCMLNWLALSWLIFGQQAAQIGHSVDGANCRQAPIRLAA